MKDPRSLLSRALLFLCALALPGTAVAAGDDAPDYRPGAAISHGNLTIFPLHTSSSETQPSGDLLTFEEADKLGVIKVAEIGGQAPTQQAPTQQAPTQQAPTRPVPTQQANRIRTQAVNAPAQGLLDELGMGNANIGEQAQVSSGARVNAVSVSTTGDKPVFLMAGDVILGGKQDRVIGKDTIVPPNTKAMEVEVFCVEHGRWNGQTASFQASGSLGHSKLRDSAVFDSNQSAVWEEVAATNAKNAAKPATGTYRASLEKTGDDGKVTATVGAILPKLATDAASVGIAVAIDGKVVAVEGFANPKLFAKVREKLLRSYALEAAGSSAPAPGAIPEASAVTSFLAEVRASQKTREVQSGEAGNVFEESESIQGVRTLSPSKASVHEYYKTK